MVEECALRCPTRKATRSPSTCIAKQGAYRAWLGSYSTETTAAVVSLAPMGFISGAFSGESDRQHRVPEAAARPRDVGKQ
jgi:hypothetical protein